MLLHGPSRLKGPLGRASVRHPAAEQPPVTDGPTASEDLPVRTDLIERIQKEIAAGTYDTPEKWEIALDRLFRRLHED